MNAATFFNRGWTRFDRDDALVAWAAAARPIADDLLANPSLREIWMRSGGTWFAGVNVFPNTADGSVAHRGVPPLSGAACDFIHRHLVQSDFDWDQGQISVCLSGYPLASPDESDAAFRFRRDRDAAHMDGLRRVDPGGRRHLGEAHGFILGIALSDAGPDAAPTVVYEGSHRIMRRALQDRLAGLAPQEWSREDVTQTYTDARREVFDTCPRITLPAVPGEANLIHRLALHGIAPWRSGNASRMIAYFRPDLHPGAAPDWWLNEP